MARGRVQSNGSNAMTYNFGIALSAATVRQMRVLTGSTLELAAVMYGMYKVTSEYTDTLKKQQTFFGGQVQTMAKLTWAQNQLLKGATEFGTGDVMQGMITLQQVGIDATKQFKFLSSAASSTGQTFTQFSHRINSAVQGNMQGLVEMGLLTQRSAKYFDKFAANTVQRQKAIMAFITQNKVLQSAIQNNFRTISGQWDRVVEGMKMALRAVMGDPKDPKSLYNSIVTVLGNVADWINRHKGAIQKAATAIGMTLGWVVRQVGKLMKWIGGYLGQALDYFDAHMVNFRDRMHSFFLWLELWKVHIVSFLKDHKTAILGLLGAYLAFKAVNYVALWFEAVAIAAKKASFQMLAFKRLQNINAIRATNGVLDPAKTAAKQAIFNTNKPLMAAELAAHKLKLRNIGDRLLDNHIAKLTASGASDAAVEKSAAEFAKRWTKYSAQELAKKKGALTGKLKDMMSNATVDAATQFNAAKAGELAKKATNLKALKGMLTTGIAPILARIAASWTTIWSTVVLIAQVVGGVIAAATIEIWIVIALIVGAFLVIYNYWNKIWPVIYNIGATLWNISVILVKSIKNAILWIWNKLVSGASIVGSWLMSFKAVRVVVDAIKTAFDAIVNAVSWIWDKMKNIGSWLASKLRFSADLTKEIAGSIGVGSYESTHPAKTTAPVAPATTNPIIPGGAVPATVDTSMTDGAMGGGVTVSAGAVQITVQGGKDWDEKKLADFIYDKLNEFARKQKVTGGA